MRTGEIWSTGSCRSIPEFNIITALRQYGGILSHFGGHAQAAGFTIPTGKLPKLKQGLQEIAAAGLKEIDLRPHIDIDAIISLPELVKNDIFKIIQQMSPFGKGNPLPIFISLGVVVVECRTMGAAGDHLRMRLRQEGYTWDAIGFGMGSGINEMTSPLDIVYTIEMDRWNGKESLRLNILDVGNNQ